ncbi:hypothetical protein HA402_003946 [Bradysia odoriphaga]|nr:hypothetical protein HA402_003946 [Bradysia odoriphaga]
MFKVIIFVAFVISSVFGAPAPAPAPAPKPHYVSTVPFGYSAYASPYVASPYVGSYVSPYSYAYGGYSPLAIGGVGAYGAYGAYPYAFY